MHQLSTGVLDWEREERISDRFGLVELFLGPGEVVTRTISPSPSSGFQGSGLIICRKPAPPTILHFLSYMQKEQAFVFFHSAQ